MVNSGDNQTPAPLPQELQTEVVSEGLASEDSPAPGDLDAIKQAEDVSEESISALTSEISSAIQTSKLNELYDPTGEYEKSVNDQLALAVKGILVDEKLNPQERYQKIAGLRDIIATGLLGGHQIDGPVGIEAEIHAEQSKFPRRLQMAEIYIRSPETAAVLAETQTFAFHASNSGSLIDIAEHGLVPGEELANLGIASRTGEWVFQPPGGQKTISGAELNYAWMLAHYSGSGRPRDVRSLEEDIEFMDEEIERRQAKGTNPSGGLISTNTLQAAVTRQKDLLASLRENPNDLKNRLFLENIPVLWGLSNDLAETQRMDHRAEELWVEGTIAPQSLKVVAVPRSKISYVRELLKSEGMDINIVPIEDILHREDRHMKSQFVEGRGMVESPKT